MSRVTKKEAIESRIRMVNRLEKELQEINAAYQSLGYITLEKPLRNGWYKTLCLRSDILRSKKAKAYQEVLETVLVKVWGREKKHADKRWNKYFRSGYYNYQRPGIKRLSKKEYDKLSTRAKKCFVSIRVKRYSVYRTMYSCVIPRYYFVESYERAYITEYKVTSTELESRSKEIDEILDRRELRRYSKYFNYKYRLYYNPHKGKRRRIRMKLSKTRLFVNCVFGCNYLEEAIEDNPQFYSVFPIL